MECKQTREILTDYADGGLNAAQAADVRAHLESCADCRRELELLKGTWKLLGEYPTIEADLLPRVRRSIHHPVWRVLRVAAPLAAAAAVLLVVAMLVIIPGGPPPSDAVQAEVEKMPPQDRELLMELARDDDRELIENMDLIHSLELVGADHLNEGEDLLNGGD